MSEVISMYVPATLIAAFSVPLIFNLIPPNRFYGIRTKQTLADKETWFLVNRFGGIALIMAVGFTFFSYYIKPELSSGQSFMGLLTLFIPIILALLVTNMYARGLMNKKSDYIRLFSYM